MEETLLRGFFPGLGVLTIILAGIAYVASGVRGRYRARKQAKFRIENAPVLGARLVQEIGPLSEAELVHFYNFLAVHVSALGSVDANMMRSLAADARTLRAEQELAAETASSGASSILHPRPRP